MSTRPHLLSYYSGYQAICYDAAPDLDPAQVEKVIRYAHPILDGFTRDELYDLALEAAQDIRDHPDFWR